MTAGATPGAKAEPFQFPPEQQQQRKRARTLSWLSLALLISTAVLVWATLGQSEAMKTAWVEDLLGLVPPIVMLVALRVENRAPSKRYPYGYFRVVSIAFLITAAVLSLAGLWLLRDSVAKLIARERPPVGAMTLFGHTVWAGWPMIAALTYCVAIGILLGRLKGPVAEKLNDRALAADADMNKAGWMSEGAAIIGILLIGYGKWWGDSLAAAFISLNIVRDGWVNLRQVVADLMDESPTKLGGHELEALPDKIRAAAEQLPWVDKAAVRLREHGHVISGDVFIVPRDQGQGDLVKRIERAADDLAKVDWRIYSLTVMPVSELD
ncbi:MAG TPA: cation transporter [Gemmatimonadaceae bacterium]|nr:cation transporter [Gemmatimonadaceae bacterium]